MYLQDIVIEVGFDIIGVCTLRKWEASVKVAATLEDAVLFVI